jgi:phage tail sheath protein FI
MATYLRPGVYVEESLNALAPSVGPNSTTVAAFLGASDRGPSAPTLVTSWSDYASKFGTWNYDTTLNDSVATVENNNLLPMAIKLFFDNGGSSCYVKRVTAGTPAASTRTFLAATATTGSITAIAASAGTVTYSTASTTGLSVGSIVTITGATAVGYNLTAAVVTAVTAGVSFAVASTATGSTSTATWTLQASIASLTAKNAGAWGNNIYVTIVTSAVSSRKDVVIAYPDVNTVVESFTDVTFTDPTDSRYAISFINSRSNYVVAASLATTAQPANTATPQQLVSGSIGTAPTATQIAAAVTSFDTILNSLVLNAPGVFAATDVNVLLTYAESRDDVFVLIDPGYVTSGGATRTPLDVQGQLALALNYQQTSLGAVYFPHVTIADPVSSTTGATKLAHPGGAIAGLIATTDASRGVFKAPAGLGSRLADVVAVTPITNADLDSLNSAAAPVNPIRYVAGSGFVVMGSRTIKPGYVDRYVPVRRTLIYLRKALTDLTEFAIFEPNDAVLWRSLNATVSAFLTNFWSQGGLRGDTPGDAFFIKCDAELNTTAVIDEGKVIIEVGVALQRPAEFVIIKIGQFDGGATVTVTA